MRRLIKIRKNLQKSIDAYAVILVLLASITYIGFLQPPGSFDEGGLIGTSSRLRWFVYCNSFSFFFSIIDLLLCVSGKPDLDIKEPNNERQLARPVIYTLIKLLGVNLLFVVSLTCCMGAYLSAGTVVQKVNIADWKTILTLIITGLSFYFVFIVLLLFLFTVPTLHFFSTASTCCSSGCSPCITSSTCCSSGCSPCKTASTCSSSGCSPCKTASTCCSSGCSLCKTPCKSLEDYLTKLDDKLLDRKGGILSSPTPIHQEKKAEQQNSKQSHVASTSIADSRGKGPAKDYSPCETTDKNRAMIGMRNLNPGITIAG